MFLLNLYELMYYISNRYIFIFNLIRLIFNIRLNNIIYLLIKKYKKKKNEKAKK